MKYIIKGKTFYDEVSYLVNHVEHISDANGTTIFAGSYGWVPKGFDSEGKRVFKKFELDKDIVIPNDRTETLFYMIGGFHAWNDDIGYIQWRNSLNDNTTPFYVGNDRSEYTSNFKLHYNIDLNIIDGSEYRLTNNGTITDGNYAEYTLPMFMIKYTGANKAPELFPISKLLVDPEIFDVKSVFWLGRHEPEVLMRSK